VDLTPIGSEDSLLSRRRRHRPHHADWLVHKEVRVKDLNSHGVKALRTRSVAAHEGQGVLPVPLQMLAFENYPSVCRAVTQKFAT
jgi:hypothetical protein